MWSVGYSRQQKQNNVGNMFKGKKQKYKNNLNAVVLTSLLFTVANIKTSVMLFVECECLRWFMWFDSFMKDWIHHFFFLILPNKFLKHVIIVFVLTSLTWKRSRINFLYKKMTPKLVFLHSWKKSPSPWKKKKINKKYFRLICADKIFRMVCEFLLKINGSRF